MEGPITPNQPLGPPPPGMVSDFNNPLNYQRYAQFVATLVILFTLSTICVLLRVWTRVVIKQFGWDDGFAVVSWILNILITVGFASQVKYGIANYDWNVRALQWFKDDADWYNYWNAVGSIVYYIVYALLKISILFLFLRLLGHANRIMRICVFVLMVVVCAGTLASIIAILKMCSSTTKFFHPLTTPGTCHFNTQVFVAQAFFTVATDILIFIPPLPIIWNMSMSFPRKIGLAVNLSLGLVVTAIAIVRALYWNKQIKYTLYDNYYGIYWAILEVNFALAAVCLPALTQLFRRHQQRSRPSKESPVSPSGATPSDPSSKERSGPRSPHATRMPQPMGQVHSEEQSGLGFQQGDSEKQLLSTSSEDQHSLANSGRRNAGPE